MKIAVIVFPGSNCDHDAYSVLKGIRRMEVNFVWHKATDLNRYEAILIPGGFSYGDYLRAGSIAKFSPIMTSVIDKAKRGYPVLGICNGFQVLVESGLLPGALITNRNLKFLSRPVSLVTRTTDSVFTRNLNKGEKLVMPIAHRQGNFTADEETLKEIRDDDRIVFTYGSELGGNPNGSVLNIAGILNKERNVLGMMPHPERAADPLLGSTDGLKIFESLAGNS
ncbi:MAG: phosphoribosylformylglycinamidine synthase subunit PurQ [FCB group bacterium]|nr:phosphoribosylformylglycinamidine synthase subunit PurQ [FCB group bacterium]